MPELDGPTIAAVLTARQPGLPVLFMSGYPRDREGEISGAAAAGSVLAKPFDARQLAEAVRRALDRSASRAGDGRKDGARAARPSRADAAGASGLDDVQDVDQDVEDGQDSDHGAADAHDPADIAAHVAVFLGRADRQRALAAGSSGGIEVGYARTVARAPGGLLGGAFLGHDLGFELGCARFLSRRKALAGSTRGSRLLASRRTFVLVPLAGSIRAAGALGHVSEGPPVIVRWPVEHSIPIALGGDSSVHEPPCRRGW